MRLVRGDKKSLNRKIPKSVGFGFRGGGQKLLNRKFFLGEGLQSFGFFLVFLRSKKIFWGGSNYFFLVFLG